MSNDTTGVSQTELDFEIENIEGETKAEKFTRMATSRFVKAVKMIRLISNLANRGNYDYTDDQVRSMFNRLRDELDACEQEFARKTEKEIEGPF